MINMAQEIERHIAKDKVREIGVAAKAAAG